MTAVIEELKIKFFQVLKCDERIRRIDSKPCSGIKARNTEQAFALNALLNRGIPLVILTGKAGTGKTLVALAVALECKKDYRQIFLARPAVPLSNKVIGYLPGDIKSKLDPYMQPLFDNLSVIENGHCGDSNRKPQVKERIKPSLPGRERRVWHFIGSSTDLFGAGTLIFLKTAVKSSACCRFHGRGSSQDAH